MHPGGELAAANRPPPAGHARAGRVTRRERPPPSDQALLEVLWQVSHYGWIAETTIQRALIISDAHEIIATGLPPALRQLLDRGWVEHRDQDASANEPEWRVSDSGRDALAHRA